MSEFGQTELNIHLLWAILSASFGSAFQHGYNTGVLANIEHIVKLWLTKCDEANSVECPNETETVFIWACIVSVFCLGGLFGGLLVGVMASTLGRKRSILASNIFVALGAVSMGMTKIVGSYLLLLAGRFFVGIASGMAAGFTPMYLTEIAPSELKGAVGTVYQLILTISISIAQILGLSSLLGRNELWPFLLAATAVPGICQFITFTLCPDSPSYLYSINDVDGATKALRWLRDRKDVSHELEDLRMQKEQDNDLVTLKRLIKTPGYAKSLLTTVMLMIMQQASGINAVLFYSTTIFESAGLAENAQFATIGLGLFNVMMTVVAIYIIEKTGRKRLLIGGLIGMSASMAALMICLLISTGGKAHKENPTEEPETVGTVLSLCSVSAVISYVAFFAIGPGPIPWFIVNELFNPKARPAAASVGVAVNWFVNFLIAWMFPPIQAKGGPFTFLIFIISNIAFIVYLNMYVSETKGKK